MSKPAELEIRCEYWKAFKWASVTVWDCTEELATFEFTGVSSPAVVVQPVKKLVKALGYTAECTGETYE